MPGPLWRCLKTAVGCGWSGGWIWVPEHDGLIWLGCLEDLQDSHTESDVYIYIYRVNPHTWLHAHGDGGPPLSLGSYS